MRQVVYPERKNEAPFRGLVAQLKSFDVPVNMGMPGGVYGLGLIVGAVRTEPLHAAVLTKPLHAWSTNTDSAWRGLRSWPYHIGAEALTVHKVLAY